MRVFSLILKGMAYGVTHVAPGLGGAIVLLLLGIYEEFVEVVGNFFVHRNRWRQYLGFLIPLGIGTVLGVVVAAVVIDDLLVRYPAPTMFLFIGLLAGTIPSIFQLHENMHPTPGRLVAVLAGAGLVLGVHALERLFVGAGAATMTLLTPREIAYNSLVSFLAGGASVTPGLDGSTVLLIGRTYEPVLSAVAQLRNFEVRWGALLSTVIFAGLGILVFSKVIDVLIKRGRALAYYVVLGLILGSVFDLWTRTDTQGVSAWVLAICLLVGIILALVLGRSPQEPGPEPETAMADL